MRSSGILSSQRDNINTYFYGFLIPIPRASGGDRGEPQSTLEFLWTLVSPSYMIT